jgi:hypothetical protein
MRPISRRTVPSRTVQPLTFQRKGCSETYRAHQRRFELGIARRVRWSGPAADYPAQRRPMSNSKGADLILNALPRAKELLGDKGYDAN